MKSRRNDQEDIEKRSNLRGPGRRSQGMRDTGAEPDVDGAGSQQSDTSGSMGGAIGGSIASERSAMRQGGMDVNDDTWEALDAELGSHSGRKLRRER
jgi:hypothetical protein